MFTKSCQLRMLECSNIFIIFYCRGRTGQGGASFFFFKGLINLFFNLFRLFNSPGTGLELKYCFYFICLHFYWIESALLLCPSFRSVFSLYYVFILYVPCVFNRYSVQLLSVLSLVLLELFTSIRKLTSVLFFLPELQFEFA